MFLILGLGNPGDKYKKTRHNVGFRIVEEMKKRGDFPDFSSSKKAKSELCSGFLGGEKIILVKPQTLMNDSGKAAKFLISNLKFPSGGGTGKIKNLIVIHDDLDLPLGKIKIVKGRGAAGHKGVDSIIKELKTKSFVRFRVGIRAEKTRVKRKTMEGFVLQKFNKEEEVVLKRVIDDACRAIEMVLEKGLEKAMTEFNK